ncbi:MAG: hypothetical protein ABIM98_06065 [candidate division WOR-3 bacterium]
MKKLLYILPIAGLLFMSCQVPENIKALPDKVSALETKVQELESKVSDLESRVNELKTMVEELKQEKGSKETKPQTETKGEAKPKLPPVRKK